MLTVKMGNMPPKSTAYLRAYCHQQLEIDDLSYCFRLPMAYIPAYMGNVAKAQPKVQKSEQAIANEMPIKQGFSGLWDINVTIKADAELERVASLNHPVQVSIAEDLKSASVSL